ncbi:MAG: hypothetical protein IJM57_06740 [Lachnospiraceae bacterium]|nr:hypothetical protein [Lachnospiraceae bacterium]
MSIKSIEHRLCCGFYDMAWLNLSAGIENLPDAADDGGNPAFSEIRTAIRKMFSEAAIPVADSLASGNSEGLSEGTEALLSLRGKLAATVELASRLSTEATVLRRSLLRRIAAGTDTAAVNVEDEVRSLLNKIFAGGDPMITNQRIGSMVSAFPARLTKTRFLDLVAGYLSLYNGQEDGEGLNAFLYRLRSAAAIPETAGDTTGVADMTEFETTVSKLREAAYGEIGSDLQAKADAAGEFIQSLNEMIGEIESVVRCINPLAAIGILQGLPKTIREDSSVADELAPAVRMQLHAAAGESVPGAEFDRAVGAAHAAMEQFFEPLSVLVEQETGRMQAAIDEMDDETAEEYVPLMKAARLMSTSAFADLTEKQAEAATPERVAACRDALFADLEVRLSGIPKAVTREWMAEVLAELPVWFESRTEVMEYMLQSLRGCRTEGEKEFAVKALRSIL